MKTIAQAPVAYAEIEPNRSFVLDTTFVLFFLAFDCGQRIGFGFEGFLSALTLMTFVVLPYFLPYDGEKPAFERWVIGRAAIACLAILLGFMFRQSIGVLLPEMSRFVPLTLLIAAGIISCCVQFNNLVKFRLAK